MSDEAVTSFLRHWFEGFAAGLHRVSPAAREAMLEECGRACGRSFTVGVFREAWAGAGGAIEPFLHRLEEAFPGSSYERTGPDALRVTYRRCGCDLVTGGWVRTPALCRCSAFNLRDNLAAALGPGVEVELVSSLLAGADRCELRARIPLPGAR